MPCFNEDNEQKEWERIDSIKRPLASQISFLEAMLCSSLNWMEGNKLFERFLKEHDEVESGITAEQFERWFKIHKEKDEQRKAEEIRKEKERKITEKQIKKRELENGIKNAEKLIKDNQKKLKELEKENT